MSSGRVTMKLSRKTSEGEGSLERRGARMFAIGAREKDNLPKEAGNEAKFRGQGKRGRKEGADGVLAGREETPCGPNDRTPVKEMFRRVFPSAAKWANVATSVWERLRKSKGGQWRVRLQRAKARKAGGGDIPSCARGHRGTHLTPLKSGLGISGCVPREHDLRRATLSASRGVAPSFVAGAGVDGAANAVTKHADTMSCSGEIVSDREDTPLRTVSGVPSALTLGKKPTRKRREKSLAKKRKIEGGAEFAQCGNVCAGEKWPLFKQRAKPWKGGPRGKNKVPSGQESVERVGGRRRQELWGSPGRFPKGKEAGMIQYGERVTRGALDAPAGGEEAWDVVGHPRKRHGCAKVPEEGGRERRRERANLSNIGKTCDNVGIPVRGTEARGAHVLMESMGTCADLGKYWFPSK